MENLYMNARHVHAVQTLSERPLTKLDALRILANAYYYLNGNIARMAEYGHDIDAESELFHKFHYVRRSTALDDLKPASVVNEGLNGPMPKFF